MDIYIGGKDRMYELFENVSNKDFIWIQCIDSFEKREVVKVFERKGYISCLRDCDYDGLPHIIIIPKDKMILHCGPSMAATLKRKGVHWKYGDEFLERRVN